MTAITCKACKILRPDMGILQRYEQYLVLIWAILLTKPLLLGNTQSNLSGFVAEYSSPLAFRCYILVC